MIVCCIVVPFLVAMAQEAAPSSEKAPSADEIAKLIKELGAEEFATREAATKRLVEIGKPAVGALQEALKSEDAEVVWRAREALRKIGEKERKDFEPQRKTQSPWGEEEFPSEDWMNELRRQTESLRKWSDEFRKRMDEMRKETMDELKRVFPELAEEMEKMERRFENFPRLDLPEDFDEFFKKMEETNKALKKMLEEEFPKKSEDAKSSVVVKVRQMTSKSGEPPRIKIQVYEWKNGELVKKEETDLLGGEEILGVSVGRISDVLRYHLKIEENEGVIITDINENGPLYKAGLRKNDIILKADGQSVKDYDSLLKALQGKAEVKLTVLKAGKKEEIVVTLPKKEGK
jgi:C-terminal processing protease CtpA/Prc